MFSILHKDDITHLFDGNVLDQSRHHSPRLCLTQLNLLHIERVCIRVLLNVGDLTNTKVEVTEVHLSSSLVILFTILLGLFLGFLC